MNEQERAALAIRRLDQAEKQKDEAALRYLLDDERGRWMLMRLYDRCHMDRALQLDHIELCEGERRVALSIHSAIRALGTDAMEGLYQARAEYEDFKQKRQQAIENARRTDDDTDI